MSWTDAQITRIGFEESIINEKIPHFKFKDKLKYGLTTVYGDHVTSSTKKYRLYVWIKSDFPFGMPGLYITSPCPLYGYKGVTIQSYGTSHAMHVWSPDWNNYVRICHCKQEYWSASHTIYGVLMKGLLWLEAFEAHCRTGKSIDNYSLTY